MFSRVFGTTKRVLGKVKGGVEGGARLFSKINEAYRDVKNFASNVPMVGEMINKAEGKADELVKNKVGLGFNDLKKVGSTVRGVVNYLPG
jgi:hypothetical protein